MVASGRVDAHFEHGLNPWDWAAGGLIAAEAGPSSGCPRRFTLGRRRAHHRGRAGYRAAVPDPHRGPGRTGCDTRGSARLLVNGADQPGIGAGRRILGLAVVALSAPPAHPGTARATRSRCPVRHRRPFRADRRRRVARTESPIQPAATALPAGPNRICATQSRSCPTYTGSSAYAVSAAGVNPCAVRSSETDLARHADRTRSGPAPENSSSAAGAMDPSAVGDHRQRRWGGSRGFYGPVRFAVDCPAVGAAATEVGTGSGLLHAVGVASSPIRPRRRTTPTTAMAARIVTAIRTGSLRRRAHLARLVGRRTGRDMGTPPWTPLLRLPRDCSIAA